MKSERRDQDREAGPVSAMLVANVDVCLPLAGYVWRVEAGHRLVLTLATSDTMYFGSRYPAVYQISNVSLDLPTPAQSSSREVGYEDSRPPSFPRLACAIAASAAFRPIAQCPARSHQGIASVISPASV